MKLGTTTRLAVLTLIVAPLAGLAFAQGASATSPRPRPTHTTCAVEVDTATWPKPSPCPSGSPSASVSTSVSASPSKSASVSPSTPRGTYESPSGTAHRTPTPSTSPVAASLPVTGTSGTIALVGLAAVVVGAVVIVVSRRRRDKVEFAAE